MKLFDQHLHSRHSFDCETDPRDNVMAAIDRGLAGLIFTEHFDTHPNEWPDCRYDDKAYSADLAALRREFGDQIFVGKGIEVCYQPEQMDFILGFLADHEFDMVMLSVHWAQGRRLYIKDEWKGMDETTGTRIYLEAVLDAVRLCRKLLQKHGRPVFDVLGHLDFVKRYTHRFFGASTVDAHGDLLDEILGTCLEAELIPEVNTSTLRNDQPEPMPGPNTIRRYANAGGTVMSIGSDSHRADAIGSHFADVVGMFQSAGIGGVVRFDRRDRSTMLLAEIGKA